MKIYSLIIFFFISFVPVVKSSECQLAKLDGVVERREKLGVVVVINKGTRSEKSFTVDRSLIPKFTPFIDQHFFGIFGMKSFVDGTREHIYELKEMDYKKINPLKDATIRHFEKVQTVKCPA